MNRWITFFLILVSSTHGIEGEESTSRKFLSPYKSERPLYLESYRDHCFEKKVTRIVADRGELISGTEVKWGGPVRHIYSSVAAWDCSDSLLAIRNAGATKSDGSGAREWVILDGKNFKPLSFINRSFTEFRWWNTKPGKMLIISSEGLFNYDPVKDMSSVISSSVPLFDRYRKISLSSQGNLSDDDSEIVLIGELENSSTQNLLLFSFKEEKVLIEISLNVPRVDYATISPKGNYIVVNGEFVKDEPDRTRIFDRNGRQVGKDWGPYGTPSHYDLALDEQGDEIAVGVAKSALPGIRPGSVISRSLKTGEIKLLLKGGYPMHFSTRNLKLPRWVFVSYGEIDSKTYPPFSNELVAVRTDGSGEFRRLCQFQMEGENYWAQPQACPNTSGTAAIFATNWNQANGRVECAIVETGLHRP